jgi:Tfp pilus assembly protein PilX
VGLIFDLAIAALALVVVGSLALLAWTLAVTAVDGIRRETAAVREARSTVAAAEARLRRAAAAVPRADPSPAREQSNG